MRLTPFFIICFGAIVVCQSCKANRIHPVVVLYTTMGDIEIELYTAQAPKTTAAFMNYVEQGWYDSASFYRVLSQDNQPTGTLQSELIQGGLWQRKKQPVVAAGIAHEGTNVSGLTHHDGAVSLARLAAGTGSTEFFICIGDQPDFDQGGTAAPDGLGYAVFGRVVKGMNTVKQIYRQPDTDQYFDKPVFVNSAKLLQ